MRSLSGLDWTALILTVIGGINWGLVAINPNFDLVALIGGGPTGFLARVVYALVGLSAIYLIFAAGAFSRK
jgi:uncharacterized membrane protein YuzA (DUF378 family)